MKTNWKDYVKWLNWEKLAKGERKEREFIIESKKAFELIIF